MNPSPPDMGGSSHDAVIANLVRLSDDDWLHRMRHAERPLEASGRLGSFELLGVAGRGAQGIVYRARQAGTDRVIAIKRLVAGPRATGSLLQRFDREIKLSAALRHPHIVSVLGVETVNGQPILAMEWVDGVAVDRWSTSMPPRSIADRLRLFVKICDAVQYAHQRGVIHRDLKPSNILVDAESQPRVLDFGLAKLLEPDEVEIVQLTRATDFVGTPAFAAPEQVRGEHDRVDVRTDIYALGVVLFQLLTGRLPYLHVDHLAALLDDIRHAEPLRPSAVAPGLHGDLDAIVGKALAKDETQRYPSVDSMAADIRRHLAGEAVDARRGQRWYALGKALRRHRGVIGVAGAIFIASCVGIVTLSWMYSRQSRLLVETAAARESETKARLASRDLQVFLGELLAKVADLGQSGSPQLRRDLVAGASLGLAERFADQPVIRAAAEDAVGRTYQQLGLYPEAEPHLRTALALRRACLGERHAETADSYERLGDLMQDMDRYDASPALYRSALDIRRSLFGDPHADVAAAMDDLALCLQNEHRFGEAEQAHREALALFRDVVTVDDTRVARCIARLACAIFNQSEFERSLPLFREAFDMNRRMLGEDHPDTIGAEINVGRAAHKSGRWDEAADLFRDGIARARRTLGPEHDTVAWGLHRLGLLQHDCGADAEAERMMREALAIYTKRLGEESPYVAMVLESLAAVLESRGESETAHAMNSRAQVIWQHREIPPYRP